MTDRITKPLAKVAAAADDVFVTCAMQLEDVITGATRTVANRAVSLIPAVTDQACEAVLRVGRQTEAVAQSAASESVLLESIPPAADRTAAILHFLGSSAARLAGHVVKTLLPAPRPPSELADELLEQMGERVSTHVREGLDAYPVGRSLKHQVRAVRRLGGPR